MRCKELWHDDEIHQSNFYMLLTVTMMATSVFSYVVLQEATATILFIMLYCKKWWQRWLIVTRVRKIAPSNNQPFFYVASGERVIITEQQYCQQFVARSYNDNGNILSSILHGATTTVERNEGVWESKIATTNLSCLMQIYHIVNHEGARCQQQNWSQCHSNNVDNVIIIFYCCITRSNNNKTTNAREEWDDAHATIKFLCCCASHNNQRCKYAKSEYGKYAGDGMFVAKGMYIAKGKHS